MIPSNLQPILWSSDVKKLDYQRDRNYIVHQVLAYGTWKNLEWLFIRYSLDEIQNVFMEAPTKEYTTASYNFVKNYILEMSNVELDPKKYVKTFRRDIRQ